MKILVQHRNGDKEIISLVPPVSLIPSCHDGRNAMSRLVSADGMEHWFNDSDGTYDGWGQAVDLQFSSVEEAQRWIVEHANNVELQKEKPDED